MNFQAMDLNDESLRSMPRAEGTLLNAKAAEEKSKPKSKKREIKFYHSILKQHMSFLGFIAFGASDSQLLDMLYEIEPEQLAAVRHIVGNAAKANKDLIQDFVEADNLRAMNRITPPKNVKMKAPSVKRVDNLKKFLQNLLSEKATRAQLRSKARFIRYGVMVGLDVYVDITPSPSIGLPFPLKPDRPRTSTTGPKKNDVGKRDGSDAKKKPAEKKRKRKAEGVPDDRKRIKSRRTDGGEKRTGETTGNDEWRSKIDETLPGRKEQEEWFHNTFAPSDDEEEVSAKRFKNSRPLSKTLPKMGGSSEIQARSNKEEEEDASFSESSFSGESDDGEFFGDSDGSD